jgi:hypothetical protein
MEQVEQRRYFGGRIDYLPERKDRDALYRAVRNFNNKHLKAYLRGEKRFSYGKDANHEPVYYNVLEEWR